MFYVPLMFLDSVEGDTFINVKSLCSFYPVISCELRYFTFKVLYLFAGKKF